VDVAQLEHAVIIQFSGVAQSRYLNMRYRAAAALINVYNV